MDEKNTSIFESVELNKTTISKKVVEQLKKFMKDGTLKEGEKLPSERTMAKTLNVSRNTVREAYKILAAQGFIEIKHGLGVYVMGENTALDQMAASFFIKNDQIIELFEIRKMLETSAVRWVVENGTDEQIAELRKLVEASFISIQEVEHGSKLAQIDQEFHLFIAEISGNSILYRIMYNLIDLLEESRSFTINIPGRAIQSINDHSDIVEAIEERDAFLAEKRMFDHIDGVEKALIKNINRKE